MFTAEPAASSFPDWPAVKAFLLSTLKGGAIDDEPVSGATVGEFSVGATVLVLPAGATISIVVGGATVDVPIGAPPHGDPLCVLPGGATLGVVVGGDTIGVLSVDATALTEVTLRVSCSADFTGSLGGRGGGSPGVELEAPGSLLEALNELKAGCRGPATD